MNIKEELELTKIAWKERLNIKEEIRLTIESWRRRLQWDSGKK